MRDHSHQTRTFSTSKPKLMLTSFEQKICESPFRVRMAEDPFWSIIICVMWVNGCCFVLNSRGFWSLVQAIKTCKLQGHFRWPFYDLLDCRPQLVLFLEPSRGIFGIHRCHHSNHCSNPSECSTLTYLLWAGSTYSCLRGFLFYTLSFWVPCTQGMYGELNVVIDKIHYDESLLQLT